MLTASNYGFTYETNTLLAAVSGKNLGFKYTASAERKKVLIVRVHILYFEIIQVVVLYWDSRVYKNNWAYCRVLWSTAPTNRRMQCKISRNSIHTVILSKEERACWTENRLYSTINTFPQRQHVLIVFFLPPAANHRNTRGIFPAKPPTLIAMERQYHRGRSAVLGQLWGTASAEKVTHKTRFRFFARKAGNRWNSTLTQWSRFAPGPTVSLNEAAAEWDNKRNCGWSKASQCGSQKTQLCQRPRSWLHILAKQSRFQQQNWRIAEA